MITPVYKLTHKIVRFRKDDVDDHLRQEYRIGGKK